MPELTASLSPRFDRCRRFYEDPLRVVCLEGALLVALTLAFDVSWLVPGLAAGLLGHAVAGTLFLLALLEARPAGEQGALARFELVAGGVLTGAELLETLLRAFDLRVGAALVALAIGLLGAALGFGFTKGPRRQRTPREREWDARAGAYGVTLLSIPCIVLTPDAHAWFGVVTFLLAAAVLAGAIIVLPRAHAESWRFRVRRRESDAPFVAREWPLLAAALLLASMGAVRLGSSPVVAVVAAAPVTGFLAFLPAAIAFLKTRPAADRPTARSRQAPTGINVRDEKGAPAQKILEERADLGAPTYQLLAEILGRALRFEADEVSLRPVESGVELRLVMDGVEHVDEILADDEADRLAAAVHLLSERTRAFAADERPIDVTFSDVLRLRPRHPPRTLLLEDLGMPSDVLERWKLLLRAPGLFVVCGRGSDTTVAASLAVRGTRIDDPAKAVAAAGLQTVLARGKSPRVEEVPRAFPGSAEVLRAALCQVLLRRACPHCKRTTAPDPAVVEGLGLSAPPDPSLYHAAPGCDRCARTGYRGRTGLFEFAAFRRGEVEGIVRTVLDEGLYKARQGMTTYAELLRVLGKRA